MLTYTRKYYMIYFVENYNYYAQGDSKQEIIELQRRMKRYRT